MAVLDLGALEPDVRTGLDCGSLDNAHQPTVNLAHLQAQQGTSLSETPERQNFLLSTPPRKSNKPKSKPKIQMHWEAASQD